MSLEGRTLGEVKLGDLGLAVYRDDFVYTAPVGSFAPNALGLHDLGGNAWNWCEDLFEPGKTIRVLRGGSWAEHNPIDLPSSFRNRDQPTTRYFHYGFRVVLAPVSPAIPGK